MSESVKLYKLSDILNVKWFNEYGGRIKREDGSYKDVDYYPQYYYDALNNIPIYISDKPIQYINFRKISPRTLFYKDKVGMILVKYKFVDNQTIFNHWCYEWSLYDWLDRNITFGNLDGWMKTFPDWEKDKRTFGWVKLC